VLYQPGQPVTNSEEAKAAAEFCRLEALKEPLEKSQRRFWTLEQERRLAQARAYDNAESLTSAASER
jgi:hypothetical protein